MTDRDGKTENSDVSITETVIGENEMYRVSRQMQSLHWASASPEEFTAFEQAARDELDALPFEG